MRHIQHFDSICIKLCALSSISFVCWCWAILVVCVVARARVFFFMCHIAMKWHFIQRAYWSLTKPMLLLPLIHFCTFISVFESHIKFNCGIFLFVPVLIRSISFIIIRSVCEYALYWNVMYLIVIYYSNFFLFYDLSGVFPLLLTLFAVPWHSLLGLDNPKHFILPGILRKLVGIKIHRDFRWIKRELKWKARSNGKKTSNENKVHRLFSPCEAASYRISFVLPSFALSTKSSAS